ncbi:MAG: DUF1501 domain-containing protein [Pseudomonadota bacterium]
MNRRDLLKWTLAGSALAVIRLSFANSETDKRLVVILLRGGLDGLHAMPPYADRNYRRMRPNLAVAAPGEGTGTLDLDGYFGLHSGLASLYPLYSAEELLLIPAAATRYRARSHFDGQNMLENGTRAPYGATDGWMNRAIAGLTGDEARQALSIGPAIPLIMQGANRVQTWSSTALPGVDEDFLKRLTHVYDSDPQFAAALASAQNSPQPRVTTANRRNPFKGPDFEVATRAAADLLARPAGPRMALLEMQGWDTHFDQERRLRNSFQDLAAGIVALKAGLTGVWDQTAVVIVSEFGRTAAQNASRGTDHGTGGIAMLAGGAVRGGRVHGDWPGLSQRSLYEGRDVQAVNEYEAIFKTLLIGHLGQDQGFVEDVVFPESRRIKPMEGLMV